MTAYAMEILNGDSGEAFDKAEIIFPAGFMTTPLESAGAYGELTTTSGILGKKKQVMIPSTTKRKNTTVSHIVQHPFLVLKHPQQYDQ